MTPRRIHLVVGARPNFMKLRPVYLALRKEAPQWELEIVHTGQHYDYELSLSFFEALAIPRPQYFLEVGSGSHGAQTARALERLERLFLERKPDLVIVFGDVNSTLAGALAAVKLHIPVAHVEAGLRSFDLTMPEEVNRKLTDAVARYLFVTEPSGEVNLRAEGHPPEHIYWVGNTMIDTLIELLPHAHEGRLQRFGVAPRRYGVLTLHRPSNVDRKERLEEILATLGTIAQKIPLLFPVHPRTRKRMEDWGLSLPPGVRGLPPLSYPDFLALQRYSRFVLTDSGGVQEESTFLRIPCITLRPHTERPITTALGTNRVLGSRPLSTVVAWVEEILDGQWPQGTRPPLWDGAAGKRIARILKESFA